MSLVIRPFKPSDQPEVKALILAGLVDHWKILDPSKNQDLDDIQGHYPNATFLVAQENERIIACGALVPRSKVMAEIVRMSVDSCRRRQGLGTQLLQSLLQDARSNGFKTVILETTASWDEVIAFYLRNGFNITHYQDGDVYFAVDL